MKEYQIIREFYGSKTASRSGVPLINHIDEGLEILSNLNASYASKAAYCLHPIIQGDQELRDNLNTLAYKTDPYVLSLVLEYRNKANSYLCKPHTDGWSVDDLRIFVGYLLPEVRHMLIADKEQNEKDFILYHKGIHPRSAQLELYFKTWKEYLYANT